MKISLTEVIQDATLFANLMMKDKKLRIEHLKKETILQTDYGYDYVCNLIIGALNSYHDSLRECLKEKGIELDEIDS